MATLDEEIRRQAAISALLESPEAQAQSESDSGKTSSSDWRKWPRSEPDQIPEGHIDLKPPEIPLQIPVPTPESPAGPTNVKTDPETGIPYVEDQTTGAKILRAELATPAEKEVFKPSDVTLPEQTVAATVPTPGFIEGSQNAILNPEAGIVPPVRRAELVKFPGGIPATMPWHPAGQKPVPGFVEGSQNAILNPASVMPTVRRAELVDPDPDAQYLDPEVRRAALAGTTPKAYPTALPTGPKAPGTHTELAPPGQMDLRPDEPQAIQPAQPAQPTRPVDSNNWQTWVRADGTQPQPTKPEVTASTEPLMNAPNGQAPAALIIHHTSGRGNAANVVDGWRTERPGVGSQMIMDRDGVIHDTQKEFGYGGTGHFLHSVIPGVSNQTAVGIEVVARDDADMTPAQLESLKRLAGPGGPYANVPVYGHSQVSPGDRDNEGIRGVAAINEARKAGGAEADSGQVIQQLKDSGLNPTHYGYTGDPNLDAESVAGHGKYIDKMVAGYDVALNAAAARLVGNPQPGETFQYAGRTWRYADKVPEKYSDARFDIFDPYNTALSGGQLGGREAAAPKHEWESWTRASPTEQQAATQEGVSRQQAVLTALHEHATNMPEWYHTLEKPITGVTDEVRNAVREDFKKQITEYAQDYYKEPDPVKAFDRIMSAPNLLTSAGEIWTKMGPNFQHAMLSVAQQATSANPLMQFINVAQPDASPEARMALVKQVMAESGVDRTQFIKALYSHLKPEEAQNVDLNALLNWSDTVSMPGVQEEQARAQDSIKAAVAENRKNLRQDPTMEHTWGGDVSNAIAALPKNMAEALIPVIGQSAMFSEIYTDTLEGLRKDHPDWSEDQLKAKAAAASIPQDMLQEIVNLATLGLGGGLLKGITNPVARFATNAILHGTIAAGAGTAQQGMANVTTDRPITEGLLQAATGGFIQGAIGSGITHALAGRERPVTELLHVAPEAVPEAVPPPPRPVTGAEILGPNVPEPPPAPRPWYMQGAESGQEPLVIRGAERTTFTPQELAERVQKMPAGSPEELRQRAESFQSPAAWFLGDEGVGEVQQAQRAQAPSPPPTLAEAIRQQRKAAAAAALGQTPPPQAATGTPRPAGEPVFIPSKQYQEVPDWAAVPPGGEYKVNMATGKTEARWANPPGPETVIDKRTGKPQGISSAGPTPSPKVSEADPYVSKVANRYTAERMATGELGQIDPSQGKSTEEMVMQGLKMSPAQRESLIDNFTKSKGGSLDQHGAAIRSKEAILSVQSRDASQAAAADPTNPQLQAQAKAAHDAVTAFHNGPIKKFKKEWSDAGRGLQREIPLDYTTLNGMKEAYLKGKGNGKEVPHELEPKLKQMADMVSKSAKAESAATDNLGKEIEKQTRGKTLPSDDQIRIRIMEIMKNLPCRT